MHIFKTSLGIKVTLNVSIFFLTIQWEENVGKLTVQKKKSFNNNNALYINLKLKNLI